VSDAFRHLACPLSSGRFKPLDASSLASPPDIVCAATFPGVRARFSPPRPSPNSCEQFRDTLAEAEEARIGVRPGALIEGTTDLGEAYAHQRQFIAYLSKS
jgi:hypothetical protein